MQLDKFFVDFVFLFLEMVKVMGNFFAESLSDVGLVKLGKILEHFKVVVSGFVRHLSDTDS